MMMAGWRDSGLHWSGEMVLWTAEEEEAVNVSADLGRVVVVEEGLASTSREGSSGDNFEGLPTPCALP